GSLFGPGPFSYTGSGPGATCPNRPPQPPRRPDRPLIQRRSRTPSIQPQKGDANMRVTDLAHLLSALPDDAEIRVAYAEDPIGCVGTRDLCIYGISDGFRPPNAPELKVASGPGTFWLVTAHMIDVGDPIQLTRKRRSDHRA